MSDDDLWSRRTLVEASRRALIDYYSLQTTAHVGYIVAIVIGALTLISRLDIFFPNPENLVISTIFFAILSVLVGLGANIVGRTLYWSALAHSTIHKVKASCVPWQEIDNVPSTLVDKAKDGVSDGATENIAWSIALRFSRSKLRFAAAVSFVGFAFMFLSFATKFSPIIMLLFYLSVTFLISYWLMWRLLKTKKKEKSEKKKFGQRTLDESLT